MTACHYIALKLAPDNSMYMTDGCER